MKIFHFKLKYRIILLISIITFILLCLFYYIKGSDCIKMSQNNFISILKDVHNNVHEYSGKEIKLSGYIYRAQDFSDTQFVIARNMKISETEYRIVGFLCEYENGKKYTNGTWVKAKGLIQKGDYHGIMPIIRINTISTQEEPTNAYVLP